MKYVKMLGLLAVAVAALMAFAATASATTLTGPNGEETPTIHAVHEGTHVTLANPIANISCNSTVEGTVTSHGPGNTVFGHISKLEFTGCTNGWHVTVVTAGTLELHYKEPGVGTLTSSGATVSTTRLGVTCNYATSATDVGTFTDSSKVANAATLHILGSIPVHSGSSALCGTGAAKWEGSYTATTKLTLDA